MVERENDFRVDLHCKNPGHTTVHLKVEITASKYRQVILADALQDEVTFEVTKQLSFPD